MYSNISSVYVNYTAALNSSDSIDLTYFSSLFAGVFRDCLLIVVLSSGYLEEREWSFELVSDHCSKSSSDALLSELLLLIFFVLAFLLLMLL